MPVYYDGMYGEKGGAYNDPKPIPQPDPIPRRDRNGNEIRIRERNLPRGGSYYTLPLQLTPGRAAGYSRRWGDASHGVQKKSIDAIIAAAKSHGLNMRETAHVLAIAFVESGFNPDSAAGTTTATSFGQFIRATGWTYGLNDSNRFELTPNAEAIVKHYIKNRDIAKNRGHRDQDLEIMIYVYHHDGASNHDVNNPRSEGLRISKNQVIPYTDKIEGMLNGEQLILRPRKRVKPKKSHTVKTKHAANSVPKWRHPVTKPGVAVRNPMPPPNYHNTPGAIRVPSQAGKSPVSKQPKPWLIDKLDGKYYKKQFFG